MFEALEDRLFLTTVVISPSRDNTLYEVPSSATAFLSNGAGDNFFAGKTNQASGESLRRGVIAFDIAASVPADATIDSVTLQLHMSRDVLAQPRTVELRKLLADWGEGTSNANGNEGGGAAATTNDATWVHRFFSTANWTTQGGDAASIVSASTSVADVADYTWGSTTQMVTDVQAWLDEPSSNFGWLVVGDEAASASAKRFDTKENPSAAFRPVLTVDYTPASVWDGGGSTNNWSEAANWSGDVVPLAGGTVVFNGTSTKNSTVNSDFAGVVKHLRIYSAYTGTITLARSLNAGSLSGTGGNVNLSSDTLTTGEANKHTTFSGVISGAGGALTKVGTGSFYLRGSNTYDGATTILDGSVLVSANNALGTATGATTVGAGTSARLVFERGVNYTTAEPVTINGSGFNGIGSLVGVGNSSFGGPITLASASTIAAYPAGFTFTQSGNINTGGHALTVKGSGNTTVGGIISGGGGVTKEGTGTATFSNTNSYTGTTTVTAGTLSVTGSLSISSAVAVNSGAVLAGTGTVGAITATSGTVSPGVGIGDFTGSSANFSSGGILRIQLQGYTAGTFDRLKLSGALTMGDSSKLTLDLAGLTSSGTATGIASYGSRSGTPAPTFTTVERINNPSGFFACLTYGATSLDVTIQSGACFQWASADPNTQEIRISDILPAATRAWAATAHSVTVASLDSGIDYTHPALSRNVWINQGEIPADVRARLRDRHGDGRITLRDLNLTMNQGPGRISDLNGNGFVDGGDLLQAWSDDQDDDGNGYVDDIIGWDFVNNDNDPMDDSGHGTYGAGILTQVAPRAEILPLKFLDSNAVGSLSDAARALDYALAKGVSISSNGWAASVFSQEWLDELEKAEAAGHLFVTAAGNGDPALLRILSRLHLSNVLVVTTTGANGRLASFSNRDPEIVDLAAPGVGVLSTIPGGGYAAHSGTSVSTAYVAGIAALLRGGRPHVGRADVVDAILASSSQASSLTEAPGGGHPSLLGVIATDFRSSSQELQNALPYSVDDDSIPLSAYQPTLFSPVLRRKLFGRNAPVGSNLWLAFESAPGF